jgi:imidazole glycerol-phosphate synthase subunit HisF
MFRPRVIPVLLLKGKGLIKSVQFKNHRYIGDPINAVRIFNDLKADELVFLDILAGKENRTISLDFIKKVGEEANMPFAAGGGISEIDHIRRILSAGAEKVIINTYAGLNPDFIKIAADTFGSSSIVVCMDIKENFRGKQKVYISNGRKKTIWNPEEYARLIQEMGAGELIVQSILNDGKMSGYDIRLLEKICKAVTIPVIALGGAGKNKDFRTAVKEGYASAVAAGSMFVYHGARRGILINYPSGEELNLIFI